LTPNYLDGKPWRFEVLNIEGMKMRKLKEHILPIIVFILFLNLNLFAQVVVDTTGMDFQNYGHTGSFGQQIVVDSIGTVHVCYTKTWCTETDTGYQVMYANVTDGRKIPIPSQLPEKPVQPGIVYMDGGQSGTPVYFYYGVGGSFYSRDKYGMHWMSWAKLNENSESITPIGYFFDMDYCGGCTLEYYNPIGIEVNNKTGIIHCIYTNPGASDVNYINACVENVYCNTGKPVHLMYQDPPNDKMGKDVPRKYRRNGTKGADIAVSDDGNEVTVATLHPFSNILLHKGIYGGEVWDENFYTALDNGGLIPLFDTTNSETSDNIPNNDPKPYTEVQVCYDQDKNQHVVYDATYQDIFIDTCTTLPWNSWTATYTSITGDTLGTFYDGSEHPKLQLRYWNSITKTHTLLAECTYPLPGETYKWYNQGIIDSGAGSWGKFINEGPIADIEFFINNNRNETEPQMVCVWTEMQSDVTPLSFMDNGSMKTYYSYMKDIKVSVSNDGSTWTEPYNITNTPNRDEGEVSVYRDVIDNKIHLVYSEDKLPGSDDNLSKVDEYEDNYIKNWPAIEGHFSVPIRKETTEQVLIIYREFDLSLITDVKTNNNLPNEFALFQNYPNPFNPSTTIKYSIPTVETGHAPSVLLKIYDILGREVTTLVNKQQKPGNYEVSFDASQLSSGTYFYRLISGQYSETKKMMILK